MLIATLDALVKEKELRSCTLWKYTFRNGDNWFTLEFTAPKGVAPKLGDKINENALEKGGEND